MYTILPHLLFIICFIALWDVLKDPDKLVSITSFQSSSFNLGSILSLVIPALFTRTSTPPYSFSIAVKAFSIDSMFVTLISTVLADPPDLTISSTTSSPESFEEE